MYVTSEADIPYAPGALPPYILEANQDFRSRCWVRVPLGESPWCPRVGTSREVLHANPGKKGVAYYRVRQGAAWQAWAHWMFPIADGDPWKV